MKVIGLTGGIGSGKTTVAKYLQSLGIPVYIADDRSRAITDSPEVVGKIRAAFGPGVISGDRVDRARLAAIVFSDAEQLKTLNRIIHPAVDQDFRKWLKDHEHHEIVVKEAAILFETGSYKSLDATINVTAPEEVRIQRVMSRDNVSREDVKSRMRHQLSDDQRKEMADFSIENISIPQMQEQVDIILKKLRNF